MRHILFSAGLGMLAGLLFTLPVFAQSHAPDGFNPFAGMYETQPLYPQHALAPQAAPAATPKPKSYRAPQPQPFSAPTGAPTSAPAPQTMPQDIITYEYDEQAAASAPAPTSPYNYGGELPPPPTAYTQAPVASPAPIARPIVTPEPATPTPAASPSAPAKAPESPWGGSVEAGMQWSTGNTETQDLNAGADLKYKTTDWKNTLSASLANTEENGTQTEEEYRLEGETEYHLDESNFLFATAQYVKDRFSGYDYRIQEVAGYGRQWYDTEWLSWNSQVGAGAQHYEQTDGTKETSPLARIENEIEWQIREGMDFYNLLRADFSDVTVFRTETALKNQLVDSLFLKLAFETEHVSEVPANNEKLDTDTTLNLVWEY